MIELLPCPFCGGAPKRDVADDCGYFIECTQCHASTACVYKGGAYNCGGEPEQAKVDELWNRRAKPAEQPVQERLEKVMALPPALFGNSRRPFRELLLQRVYDNAPRTLERIPAAIGDVIKDDKEQRLVWTGTEWVRWNL